MFDSKQELEVIKNRMIQAGISEDEIDNLLSPLQKEFERRICGLVWEHKDTSIPKMNNRLPAFLRQDDKCITGTDGTDNILIEGENLYALMGLQYTHIDDAGKGLIDVIYIDPPYNTDNKEFAYNDKFEKSEWLSMLEIRLKLGRNVLSDDGFIFISIDDKYQAQLKLLCDEVFGVSNYIATMIWQKKKGGGNDSKHIAIEHEYVLFYAKVKSNIDKLFVSYDEKYIKRYKEKDNEGRFFWDTFKRKSGKQYYPIKCPDGTVLENDENGNPISWLRSEKRFLSDLKKGDARIIQVDGKWTVHFKQRQPKGYKPRSLMTENGTTADGAATLKDIFKVDNIFDNPKPIDLIEYLIKIHPNEDAIVLDFFAGSGTTGHAVLRLNGTEGSHRKFILCTNNEVSRKKEKMLIKNGVKPGSAQWESFGICKSVTYPRVLSALSGNDINGNSIADSYDGNLYYYSIDDTPCERATEEETIIEIVNKFISYVSIKESSFEIQNNSSWAKLLSSAKNETLVITDTDMTLRDIKKKTKDAFSKDSTTRKVYCKVTEHEQIEDILYVPYPKEIMDILSARRRDIIKGELR